MKQAEVHVKHVYLVTISFMIIASMHLKSKLMLRLIYEILNNS